MILIHIIRRKKKKKKKQKNKQTNFLPTHIKHNSSKIITIIITIIDTIDSITWTFCTISFKLAIGPIISKELLRSIALFTVQFLSNSRSVPLFQRNYCDQSPYSLYNFFQTCDRSQYFKGIFCD
jgi:hypothetical protein